MQECGSAVNPVTPPASAPGDAVLYLFVGQELVGGDGGGMEPAAERVVRMQSRTLNRRLRLESGNGALAYIVVAGSTSILILQPSLIVAAVDRLDVLWKLFVHNIQFLF